jgi:hypothetical protein
MESMLYRGHGFLLGIKHFGWPWGCVRRTLLWKTLHVKNGRKFDIWQSQWSVVNWIWITKSSMWHCHLRERSFHQKEYTSGSKLSLLAWSESVWLLPFPETQIPPQRSSFWNCEQHPKCRDRPAEGTSTWKLPALLPAVGMCVASQGK